MGTHTFIEFSAFRTSDLYDNASVFTNRQTFSELHKLLCNRGARREQKHHSGRSILPKLERVKAVKVTRLLNVLRT